MTVPASSGAGTKHPIGPLALVARIFLACAVLVAWVAVMLPNTVLADLRSDYRRFGQAINWLEHVYLPINLIHVVLFFGLGLLLALALPAVRRVTQVWWVALLAAATELVQLWVPGRSAKLGDFAADIAGGSAGLLVGWALVWLLVVIRGRASAVGVDACESGADLVAVEKLPPAQRVP